MHVIRPFGPEAIERFIAADADFVLYNIERALRRADGEPRTTRFGAATALQDPTRQDVDYYNRVVGLDDSSIERLPRIIEHFHEAGMPCHVTLTPDRATEPLLEALGDRGFRYVGGQSFFAIHRSEHQDVTTPDTIDVRRVGRDELDAVYDIWEAPFPDPIPPDVRVKRTGAHLVETFPMYLARLGGRPAAMATMFLSHGIAWLGNANTVEGERRHGCHLALLHHRLRESWRLGCEWAITDTDYGSTSHRNAERAGMRMAFITVELSLPRPA